MEQQPRITGSKIIDGRWSDRHTCGLASIDISHEEFLRTAFSLRDCDYCAIGHWLDVIRDHCEEHFREEANLMQKFDYPVRECHIAEHDAVIASIHEVIKRWQIYRDESTVRRLASALIDWFSPHVQNLDFSVAAWVVKKTTGGVPVVLRRDKGLAGNPQIYLDLNTRSALTRQHSPALSSDLRTLADDQR